MRVRNLIEDRRAPNEFGVFQRAALLAVEPTVDRLKWLTMPNPGIVSKPLRRAARKAARRWFVRDGKQAAERYFAPSDPTLARGPFTSPATTVAFTLTTLDDVTTAKAAVRALVHEAHWAYEHGHRVVVLVCDAGSSDGTQDVLAAELLESGLPHAIWCREPGTSMMTGTRLVIEHALSLGADYIAMQDPDAVAPPGFTLALLEFLSRSGNTVAGISASHQWQADGSKARPDSQFVLRCDDSDLLAGATSLPWRIGMAHRDLFTIGPAQRARAAASTSSAPSWSVADGLIAATA